MMPNEKYKFILKGKGAWFKVEPKGDRRLIMSAISQFIVQQFVMAGVPKKEFLETCKRFYEGVLKEINMRGDN